MEEELRPVLALVPTLDELTLLVLIKGFVQAVKVNKKADDAKAVVYFFLLSIKH